MVFSFIVIFWSTPVSIIRTGLEALLRILQHSALCENDHSSITRTITRVVFVSVYAGETVTLRSHRKWSRKMKLYQSKTTRA